VSSAKGSRKPLYYGYGKPGEKLPVVIDSKVVGELLVDDLLP
jgi:hypothetical protein